ncbi:hypothetical protein [Xanthomonas sp. CFBP 8445]|uniref:hypothetical protein n=1 Tax=Xanthomonas sp. CFBP 8445 TaxID=2971236 RepID=UPI00030C5C4D|nr:hypothetical protein [Xanthomonas sp. CFBP 8445]UYC12263.1 hypothetical protein NUG21_00465 [Xanthomonas sp. CFBP 8445]
MNQELDSTKQTRSNSTVDIADLAQAIADDTVRAEVELYARQHWIDGVVYYDSAQIVEPGPDAERDLAQVQRALRYIEARGDIWPWHLKRHIDNPALIHFEESAHGNH